MMGNEEKEVDEKLYRVVRKKGSHVNTKVNPDGTKSALQFTDDNNDLTGPVDLIEVDEKEYIQAEDVQNYSDYDIVPRTWGQVIVEDIVVPVARETIEQLLDIGLQHFDVWMEEKAVPTAKQKAKKAGKDISVFFLAVKSAIKGEQPRALHIIEVEKKANNSVRVMGNADSKQNEKESVDKVEITQAEFEQLVTLIKRSAVTLVGCINLLKNSAISDMDENQKIEFEKQLKELATEDVMSEINLLLEDKNKGILDTTSLAILSAFRDGKFIIDGEKVPIESFIAVHCEKNIKVVESEQEFKQAVKRL